MPMTKEQSQHPVIPETGAPKEVYVEQLLTITWQKLPDLLNKASDKQQKEFRRRFMYAEDWKVKARELFFKSNYATLLKRYADHCLSEKSEPERGPSYVLNASEAQVYVIKQIMYFLLRDLGEITENRDEYGRLSQEYKENCQAYFTVIEAMNAAQHWNKNSSNSVTLDSLRQDVAERGYAYIKKL